MTELLVLWAIIGSIVIVIGAMKVGITYAVEKEYGGLHRKSTRQIIRNAWLTIFSGAFLPVAIVPLAAWGVYRLFRVVKETLVLAFKRERE